MATVTSKRIQINKANMHMMIAISAAVFIGIFCLISTKTLLGQRSYQQRVITQREAAREQLNSNLDAASKLTQSYQQFVSEQENVIGGSAVGTGERDGDNARIVLDALPSKYDFPALATSLEKLVTAQQLTLTSVGGIDDEVNQAATAASPEPQPVEIPFDLTVNGSYQAMQGLLVVFERSIRPFNVQEMTFTAGQNTAGLSLQIKAKTYYQPEKSLEFTSEVVR